MTGVVPRFTGTPAAIRHAGPVLGAYTDEVLRELLGLRDDELDPLRRAGVIASPPAPWSTPRPRHPENKPR